MCKLQNALEQLILKLYLVLVLHKEVITKKNYRTSAGYRSYIERASFSYHNSKFGLVMSLNHGPGALLHNYLSILVYTKRKGISVILRTEVWLVNLIVISTTSV